jgi:hypothetical protein
MRMILATSDLLMVTSYLLVALRSTLIQMVLLTFEMEMKQILVTFDLGMQMVHLNPPVVVVVVVVMAELQEVLDSVCLLVVVVFAYPIPFLPTVRWLV